MGLKVAIIGLSRTTHDKAPWDDPTIEKWGLPWDEGYWIRCDRLFEMHDLRQVKSLPVYPRDYLNRLKEIEVPLYMQCEYLDVPNATQYPFGEVSKVTGSYWNSSIGYMLALAIAEGAEEIQLWGVDMAADDEYGYQRPNCEYLIGLARGIGIKVIIPDESPLCKFIGVGIKYGDMSPVYKDRYGWLG